MVRIELADSSDEEENKDVTEQMSPRTQKAIRQSQEKQRRASEAIKASMIAEQRKHRASEAASPKAAQGTSAGPGDIPMQDDWDNVQLHIDDDISHNLRQLQSQAKQLADSHEQQLDSLNGMLSGSVKGKKKGKRSMSRKKSKKKLQRSQSKGKLKRSKSNSKIQDDSSDPGAAEYNLPPVEMDVEIHVDTTLPETKEDNKPDPLLGLHDALGDNSDSNDDDLLPQARRGKRGVKQRKDSITVIKDESRSPAKPPKKGRKKKKKGAGPDEDDKPYNNATEFLKQNAGLTPGWEAMAVDQAIEASKRAALEDATRRDFEAQRLQQLLREREEERRILEEAMAAGRDSDDDNASGRSSPSIPEADEEERTALKKEQQASLERLFQEEEMLKDALSFVGAEERIRAEHVGPIDPKTMVKRVSADKFFSDQEPTGMTDSDDSGVEEKKQPTRQSPRKKRQSSPKRKRKPKSPRKAHKRGQSSQSVGSGSKGRAGGRKLQRDLGESSPPGSQRAVETLSQEIAAFHRETLQNGYFAKSSVGELVSAVGLRARTAKKKQLRSDLNDLSVLLTSREFKGHREETVRNCSAAALDLAQQLTAFAKSKKFEKVPSSPEVVTKAKELSTQAANVASEVRDLAHFLSAPNVVKVVTELLSVLHQVRALVVPKDDATRFIVSTLNGNALSDEDFTELIPLFFRGSNAVLKTAIENIPDLSRAVTKCKAAELAWVEAVSAETPFLLSSKHSEEYTARAADHATYNNLAQAVLQANNASEANKQAVAVSMTQVRTFHSAVGNAYRLLGDRAKQRSASRAELSAAGVTGSKAQPPANTAAASADTSASVGTDAPAKGCCIVQ